MTLPFTWGRGSHRHVPRPRQPRRPALSNHRSQLPRLCGSVTYESARNQHVQRKQCGCGCRHQAGVWTRTCRDTTVTLLQRGSRGSIRTLCYLCVRFIYGVLIGSYADISAGTEHGSTRHRTHNTAVKLVFRLTCRPFFRLHAWTIMLDGGLRSWCGAHLCVSHTPWPSVVRRVRGTSQERSLHSAQAGTFIWVKVGTQC